MNHSPHIRYNDRIRYFNFMRDVLNKSPKPEPFIYAQFPCVYFIKIAIPECDHETNLIKIGCTQNLYGRLFNYKSNYPCKELIGVLTCENHISLEKEIHKSFKNFNKYFNHEQEWFIESNEIYDHLFANMSDDDHIKTKHYNIHLQFSKNEKSGYRQQFEKWSAENGHI